MNVRAPNRNIGIDFTCQDCPNDGWGPMLRTELWNKIVPVGNHCRYFLCQPCMEKRLGRAIVEGDLRDCPMNYRHSCYVSHGRM